MADAAQILRRVAEHGDAGDQETAVLGASRARPGATAPVAPAPVASRPATGRPSTAGSRPPQVGQDERRRRVLPWLAAAAVLLLVVLGAGFMMLSGDPDDETPSASGSETGSASPSPKRTPSPSPSPSETPTTKAPKPKPKPPAPAEDSGTAMERAVQEYFSFMPQNTDAGWERLAPSMQAQGRDGYEQWWGSVQSVDLQSADAVDGRQVDIVLTYYFDDGSAKQETQRLSMQRSGDRYLIADDEVLSSRTVS